MAYEDSGGEYGRAIFNQAQFQQIRIHELFTRINRFSTAPLYFNPVYNDYNYNLIFNDLCSALWTLSGKLTDEENNPKVKEEIEQLLISQPPKQKSKEGTYTNIAASSNLMKKFGEFRILIEKLMEKYGIGNPNQDVLDEF